MRGKLTFLTPTYKNDFERFCLQRESMERCEIDIPHVAVIHHEDLDLFKTVPHQHKLTLVSTRDVLPPWLETRRTARGYPRKNPLYYIKPKPVHGWMTQQIVKLAAPAVVDTEGISCLDSEGFFVRKVTEDDFFTEDGRLHLYETDAGLKVQSMEWLAASMRFLDVSLRNPPKQYIHPFNPIHRQVVLEMQRYIDNKYGHSWAELMVERGLTEYITYAVYARYIHQLKCLAPVEPTLCITYWAPDEGGDFEDHFLQNLQESQAKAALINSSIGRPVASYRALVEKAWAVLNKN